MEAHIVIRELCKSYLREINRRPQKVNILESFDLNIQQHEFLTIFGPNGCGKTTLLNIIAGLTSFDSGKVLINGKRPEEAKVGFVFQSIQESLFPWRTVIDNVAFPLELLGIGKKARNIQAREFLEFLGIKLKADEYDAFSYQLSGGQQQLISIARALINEPDVLLLDEPFNQLDYQTRMSMQTKVAEVWQKLKTTVVFVSHDIDEAILLGDRTALLSKRPGRVMDLITNSLPHPREPEMVLSPEFLSLKNRALRVFRESLLS